MIVNVCHNDICGGSHSQIIRKTHNAYVAIRITNTNDVI